MSSDLEIVIVGLHMRFIIFVRRSKFDLVFSEDAKYVFVVVKF